MNFANCKYKGLWGITVIVGAAKLWLVQHNTDNTTWKSEYYVVSD